MTKGNGREVERTRRAPDITQQPEPPTVGSFPIVGIGASAGGLDAFRQLLAALPKDTGMAFVLVQHLDPRHESILAELLSGATPMVVCEVTGDVRVEPNRIYVIPPSKDLILIDGWLKLTPRGPAGTSHMPIDSFFRTLAAAQGRQAIGVVLSGMGTDGTSGLAAIEEEGGIAFAQTPASAKSNDMPQSAIDGGTVDFVLTPEAIAHELARLGRHPYLTGESEPPTAESKPKWSEPSHAVDEDESLARILELALQAGGTDFRAYKKTTLRRRIGRRMAVRRSETLAQYAQLLESDAREAKTLCEECLVSVTAFFRDSEVFEALGTAVLGTLLKEQAPSVPLRVWAAGCATGEEAYSLAMCLLERTTAPSPHQAVQVFATDLSDRALATARAGRYSPSSLRDMPEERVQRFFTKVGDGYQINKAVRDVCIFAHHDVVSDPPYSHIDLISCRNLLIYLEPALQERVFAIFHYALNPAGFLLIGPAETVGGSSALFAAVDEKHRIYSRKAVGGLPRLLHLGAGRSRLIAERPQHHAHDASEVPREADRMLLARLGPAAVVIDADLGVIEFRGDTAPFLDHSQGAASLSLERLVRKGLLMELKQAIAEVRRTDGAVRKEGLKVRYQRELQSVGFEVLPIKGRAAAERCLLVLFEVERPLAAQPKPSPKLEPKVDTKDDELARLTQKLGQTTEYMHSLVREHESALEGLQSTTEETLSSNEELQSLNEELQTAKEEIQSANEELATLNQELQERNAELARSNERIQHGLDGTNALVDTVPRPLLILDGELRVERANGAFYETFQLSPALTQGRLLVELGSGEWNTPVLMTGLAQVLVNGAPLIELELEVELSKLGRRAVSINARRLEPESGMLGRLVLAIEDRSELRRAARAREVALAQAERAREHAESADRLKEQFVATASHELRGPLSVIASWMNILISAGERPPPATLAKALAAIGRGVTVQGRLISDLLDHAQLTSGKIDIQRHPIDLVAVAEAALVGVRPAALAKELDIRVTGDHETSVVLGDADRMQQVVWNLLLNAVKFTPRGGRIAVAIHRMGNQLQLTVSDSGCGISADFLPYAFARFRQAEESTNRSQPGLGLGLTLARELVELHGGTIRADSAGKDQGSIFTVSLPVPALTLHPPPPELAPLSEPPPPPPDELPSSVSQEAVTGPARDALDGTKLLVVDDEEDARDALVHLLERYGANVRSAASVAEAMSALALEVPDVLISDIGMPGADGYELIRRVRLLPPDEGGQLPSLAVSAYATDEHRTRMLQTGFQRALEKPVSPSVLVAEIARLAGRSDAPQAS